MPLSISPVSRRRLMQGAAALSCRASPARAARFSLSCATDLPASHPLNLRLREACDQIHQDSGGDISIQLSVNSQLGGDVEILRKLRDGKLDFLAASAQILGMEVPVAAITSVGFAFSGYEQIWPALDGPLGAHIREALQAAGLVTCGRVWDNGFRQITDRNKLIAKMVDLKNLRIRVTSGPVALTMFRDLGAAPAPMDFVDLYQALETHMFDAQENALAVIDAAQIYKLHGFCSITNHMWDGFWIIAGAGAFAQLPSDARAIITRNFDAAALRERADLRTLDAELRQKLVAHGMEINVPVMTEFRTALSQSGFYTTWKRRFGPLAWSLLEQAAGVLS